MKTLIAIPCMDKIDALFMSSVLRLRLVEETEFTLAINSLIYDSRNRLAGKAMTEGFDRVLWLDSDMIFPADLLERLTARIDSGCEFVSGLYFSRKVPVEPVIYSDVGFGENNQPARTPYRDYPRDSIFEVAGAGFGCCMTTTDLLRRAAREDGYPFSPRLGFGEDLSFCLRVAELGVPMFCDSSVKCGHLAHTEVTEETYLRGGV